MLFTEIAFLFYFLPFVLIVHRFLVRGSAGQTYRNLPRLFLFLATLYFYGFREPWWLIPFFVSIGFDFLWANLLERSQSERRRKLLVTCSVIQNIGLLFLLKYYGAFQGFLASVSPRLATWLPGVYQDGLALAMPAGISFYTFESLSFVIDVYRRELRAPKNPLEFFGFIGMFPRFIAGPIVRYQEMVGQFSRFRGIDFEKGSILFAWGFFLKTCFADSFAVFTPYAFGPETPHFASAWTGALAYTLQLYFDFSGYSLMAIGLGRCLGFEFPANFNCPYHATSFRDFWRRWHMTLSSWLRDYVYISLGGSRGGRLMTYRNLFLTMLLGGIWHGASFTFVIWGAWHGLCLCLERAFQLEKRLSPKVLRWCCFLAVVIGWVFFRADSVGQALTILGAMANPFSDPFVFALEPIRINGVSLAFCFVGSFYCFVLEPSQAALIHQAELALKTKVFITGCFSAALVWVFSAQVIPFLYFRF